MLYGGIMNFIVEYKTRCFEKQQYIKAGSPTKAAREIVNNTQVERTNDNADIIVKFANDCERPVRYRYDTYLYVIKG